LELTKKLLQLQSGQLKTLDEKLTATKLEISQLSERLKTLESPFGHIHLGLTDMMRVFPFILTALTITLAAQLCQALRVRSIIQELFRDDSQTYPVSLRVYQTSGWLFPSTLQKQPLFLMTTGFAILMTMSCRTAWLIGWDPRHFVSFVLISQSFYKFSFIVALGLMIVASLTGLKNLYIETSKVVSQLP